MTDPREAAFLEAILANPDDDTVRLVAADFLEENAGTVPCVGCRATGRLMGYYICPDCHGTGRVSDGRQERAEFLRVQCELARPQVREPYCFHDITMPDHCPRCRLRRRERELLGTRGEAWARPVAEALGLERWGNAGVTCGPGDPKQGTKWEWRRGFVEAIALTAADWLEHGKAVLAVQPVRNVEVTACMEFLAMLHFAGLSPPPHRPFAYLPKRPELYVFCWLAWHEPSRRLRRLVLHDLDPAVFSLVPRREVTGMLPGVTVEIGRLVTEPDTEGPAFLPR